MTAARFRYLLAVLITRSQFCLSLRFALFFRFSQLLFCFFSGSNFFGMVFLHKLTHNRICVHLQKIGVVTDKALGIYRPRQLPILALFNRLYIQSTNARAFRYILNR